MKKILITLSLILASAICIAQYDLHPVNAPTTAGIHDIELTTDGTIFIYTYGTGEIYRSKDGGQTWDLLAGLDSIYFEQIQFVNDKHGWICGEHGKVYFTNDAGYYWHDRSLESAGGNLLLYGMLFEDALTGMVSGALLKDRKLENKIFTTTDGGKSWIEWQNPPTAMILNLEKSPEGHTWGSGDNIIVKLDDGNWKTMFHDSTRATGQIRDLLFINRDTILGVSFNGRIIKSYDGGTSWTSSTITSNRLRTTGKVDNNSILVAGDNNIEQGNIFLSQNAGVSWTLLDSELEDIHRIAVSGAKCWLVGKNGMIIKLNL